MLPVPSVPSSSQSVPGQGHPVPSSSPSTLGRTSRPGTGTERCDQRESDPYVDVITGNDVERAPRLYAGWEALREFLRDYERHTWADCITAVTKATDLAPATAANLIKTAIKLGFADSTYKARHRHAKGARYSNRKVWLV